MAAGSGDPFADTGNNLWSTSQLFEAAAEMETLRRALQISAASSSSSPDHSDSVSRNRARGNPKTVDRFPVVAGKVGKRKSRVSKKSPTTFITADPANFRRMVQQVTGVCVADDPALPIPAPSPPQRDVSVSASASASRMPIPYNCLPTLDTSAFLLARERQQVFPASDGGVGLFDFDAASFQCFPTLESWGM